MIVALISLFVSLGGTAVAAKPVARALFANNAGKLQGSTRGQVVSAAVTAARAAPVTSVGGLVSVASREFFATPGSGTTESVSCTSGRAISAYWTTVADGEGVPVSIAPTSDTTWRFIVKNLRADGPARGTISLVCIN
jgi:hypothetical protein